LGQALGSLPELAMQARPGGGGRAQGGLLADADHRGQVDLSTPNDHEQLWLLEGFGNQGQGVGGR
jgi:hypothetical protein